MVNWASVLLLSRGDDRHIIFIDRIFGFKKKDNARVCNQTLVADIIITGFLASIIVPVVTLRALDIIT